MEIQMEYITTFTGEHFTPVKPDVNQIHIEDIAHSLSLLCRANGHFDYFFSIAQHSINCANEAKARKYPVRIQLALLLHDASEAYISDITRPVKQHLSDYRQIEECLQKTIYIKFLGSILQEDDELLLKQIDNDMLVSEFNNLMSKTKVFNTIPALSSTPSFTYKPQTEVETEFLKVYYGIMHAGIILGK